MKKRGWKQIINQLLSEIILFELQLISDEMMLSKRHKKKTQERPEFWRQQFVKPNAQPKVAKGLQFKKCFNIYTIMGFLKKNRSTFSFQPILFDVNQSYDS